MNFDNFKEETQINNDFFKHMGDVGHGLDYLRTHWNDPEVIIAFDSAKTSYNHIGRFDSANLSGAYYLKLYSMSPRTYYFWWEKK